jgi:thymidine phosphorylase
MVRALGGPIDLIDNTSKYIAPTAIIKPVLSESSGYVSAIDPRAIGLNMINLKAGRTKSSDAIDHGVGLTGMVGLGQWVDAGDPLAYANVRDNNQFEFLQKNIPPLIQFSQEKPNENPLIYEILEASK